LKKDALALLARPGLLPPVHQATIAAGDTAGPRCALKCPELRSLRHALRGQAQNSPNHKIDEPANRPARGSPAAGFRFPRRGGFGRVSASENEQPMKAILVSSMVAATLLAGSAVARADAAAIYAKQCASCHGKDGKGDTKKGKKTGARDYTDPNVQKSFTDAEAAEVIRNGAKKNGKEVMKGYAAKISDADIAALVKYIRAFAK
jgi:cytochrome c6